MPRNGSGTYSLPEAAFVNGTTIDADDMNSNLSDIATALTASLCADGQKTWTGAQNAGNQRLTALGAATAATDAMQLQQLVVSGAVYQTSGGSSNAYTLTPSPAITAYAEGQRFFFKANHTNTGSATMDVSGLGAVSLLNTPGGNTISAAGAITSGIIYEIVYNGSNFCVVSNHGQVVGKTLTIDGADGASISATADTSIALSVTHTDNDTLALAAACSHATFIGTVFRLLATRAATNAYNFAQFYSNNTGDKEFQFSGDGNGTCDGSWAGSGADYAEYFETDPGHMLASTPGVAVIIEGDRARPAKEGEEPDGVSRPKGPSRTGAIIGNAPLNWPGKYVTDAFGRYEMEPIEVVEWTTGEGEDFRIHSYEVDSIPPHVAVPENVKRQISQRRVLSPHFKANTEYVERSARDEWALVGLLGQVPLLKGQPVGKRWKKMRDVSAEVELWFIR